MRDVDAGHSSYDEMRRVSAPGIVDAGHAFCFGFIRPDIVDEFGMVVAGRVVVGVAHCHLARPVDRERDLAFGDHAAACSSARRVTVCARSRR